MTVWRQSVLVGQNGIVLFIYSFSQSPDSMSLPLFALIIMPEKVDWALKD